MKKLPKKLKIILSITIILVLLLIVVKFIVPTVQDVTAKDVPIVEISAENDTVYTVAATKSVADFTVTATYEDGDTAKLSQDAYTLVSEGPQVSGKSTVILALADNPDVICECEISYVRDKIMSFSVGHPNASDVKAVLYSNGELAFEGTGDVAIFAEGEFPWLDTETYESLANYPITSVTFEETVTPRDMNYWFEGLTTLTYVDPIPSSVTTMIRTFYGCDELTSMIDWSLCEDLIVVNECYAYCTSLTEVIPFLPSIRLAEYALSGCTALQAPADLSNATSLVDCLGLYANDSNLTSADIAPNAVDISSMFSGCINLILMPEIPETVVYMDQCFYNNLSLTTGATIPASVTDMAYAFANCQLLSGEMAINCDATAFDEVFDGSCLGTNLNLIGSSQLLSAYANTCNNDRITVQGEKPDPLQLSYTDAFPEEEETEWWQEGTDTEE